MKDIIKTILKKQKYKQKLINNQNKYSNIIDYLSKLYIDSESLQETIYRLINNFDIKPICPICGNKVKLTIKSHIYFPKCCCSKCAHIYVAQISKEKCLQLYGVSNYAKLETTKQKYKETCLKKYGVSAYYKSTEFKEKSKNTCLKKYGVEHNLQIKHIHDKGVNYSQTDNAKNKRKKTILEKYGVKNISQNPEIKKKKELTFLKHYNVKHNFARQEIRSICNSVESREKMYKTKKKNHTFNTSISEKESYKLLKEKFKDVKYQYKSELYPFVCDFYIPSLDLYIECNYHWTHGGHPYNEQDKNDNLILEKWKNKNTKYYNNAITTWTCRDVNKRNFAKQNNLNYIEFWNIDELKSYLNY